MDNSIWVQHWYYSYDVLLPKIACLRGAPQKKLYQGLTDIGANSLTWMHSCGYYQCIFIVGLYLLHFGWTCDSYQFD